MLTSLPMFDEARAASLNPLEGEDKKRLDALMSSLSKSKYSLIKAAYLSLVKYFTQGTKMNMPYQVDAILAYWLSCFVFSNPS